MDRLFPSAEGTGPTARRPPVRRSAQRLSALCPLGLGENFQTAAGRPLPRNDGTHPRIEQQGAARVLRLPSTGEQRRNVSLAGGYDRRGPAKRHSTRNLNGFWISRRL